MSKKQKRYIIIIAYCIWFVFCIFLATKHWAFKIFGAVTCGFAGVFLIGYLQEDEYNPNEKGKKAIIQRCRAIIDECDVELQETNSLPSSCKQEIIPMIEKILKAADSSDVGKDIEKESHILLFKTTYSILQSGEYNFYDSLSPFKGGMSAKKVNKKCLEWAVSNGLLTEEEAREYEKELSERIREVG